MRLGSKHKQTVRVKRRHVADRPPPFLMGPHDSQTYDVPVGLAIEFRIGSMEYYLKIGIYIVGIGL
jgi:hypothetical protein